MYSPRLPPRAAGEEAWGVIDQPVVPALHGQALIVQVDSTEVGLAAGELVQPGK